MVSWSFGIKASVNVSEESQNQTGAFMSNLNFTPSKQKVLNVDHSNKKCIANNLW